MNPAELSAWVFSELKKIPSNNHERKLRHERIRFLMATGADPEWNTGMYKEPYMEANWSLATAAAYACDAEAIEILAGYKVNFDTYDGLQTSPLTHALFPRGRSPDHVSKATLAIIRLGVDVEAKKRSEYSDSPIIEAAAFGLADVVEALIQAKADIHAVSAQGETALAAAVMKQQADVVKILLPAGAKTDWVSQISGKTLLALAQEYAGASAPPAGADQVLALISNAQNGVLPAQTPAKNNTRFNQAASAAANAALTPTQLGEWLFNELEKHPSNAQERKLRYERIQFLLETGADPAWNTDMLNDGISRSHKGYTLAMAAAFARDAEVIRILARFKVNFTTVDSHDMTPLLYTLGEVLNDPQGAISTSAALAILDTSPDVNDGQPIISASASGYIDVVKALLQAKADVNARNSWGETAIVAAVMKGKRDIVKTLLDAGADINWVSARTGKTLVQLANERAGQSDAAAEIAQTLNSLSNLDKLSKQKPKTPKGPKP